MGERARPARRPSASVAVGATPVKPPKRDQERAASKQRTFCKNAIKEMLADENSVNFSRPVSELWDLNDLPDYTEKVKRPMDLGTIQQTLEARGYASEKTGLFDPELFSADVRLTFENAILYNEDGTDMHSIAKQFLSWFEDYMKTMPRTSRPSSSNTPIAVRPSRADDPASTSPGTSPSVQDPSEGAKPQDMRAELEALRTQRSVLAAQLIQQGGIDPRTGMTAEDRVRLRDEVEALPWERCKRVVEILQAHVTAAVAAGDDTRPEFVDIDLNVVEPKLLLEIHEFLHPSSDPKLAEKRDQIVDLDARISTLEASLPVKARSSKKRERSRDRTGERDRSRRRK